MNTQVTETARKQFLAACAELESGIVASNEDDAARTARPLRQLLCESGKSLLLQVGGKRSKFMVHVPSIAEEDLLSGRATLRMTLHGDGIPQDQLTTKDNLDRFLKTRVAAVDGHYVDVNALIKFVAHVVGVVHAGTPNGDVERALQKLMSNAAGRAWVHLCLQHIALVVLRAVQELREKLESRERFADLPGTTFVAVIGIHPSETYPRFVLDFGHDEREGRLSLFLERPKVLTLRLKHGEEDWRVRGYVSQVLSPVCVVGAVIPGLQRTLLELDVGHARFARMLDGSHPFAVTHASRSTVVNSDWDLRQPSAADWYEHQLYERALSLNEMRAKIGTYYRRRYGTEQARIPHEYKLFSNGHPRHPDRFDPAITVGDLRPSTEMPETALTARPLAAPPVEPEPFEVLTL